MTIVGFNFTKISIEKLSAVKGKINISNNVSISSIEKTQLTLGTDKQDALRFNFEFTSDYNPKVGKTELNGEVLYLTEQKQMDDMLKQWKETKEIQKDVMTDVLNQVLTKCNIQALILSKDINLPPPIPLPKVKENMQKE